MSILLAGCAGGRAATVDDAIPPAPSAVVSADAGSVTGTAMDEELRPLVGVDIVVNGPTPAETRSDAQGRFTLNELAPGSYVLNALKLGFEQFAKRVDVSAGEAVEVSITLKGVLVDQEPRRDVQFRDGFMAGPDVYSPALIVYYTYPFTLNMTPGAQEVVSALAWDSSAPMTSKYLALRLQHEGERNSSVDASPVVVKLSELDVKKSKAKIEGYYSVGFKCSLNPTCFTSHPDALMPVVSYQQRVKIYSTIFYNELAPEGYSGLPE